ncbi:MAG TPA: GNAT family N-acetyltransferase [Anaerolineales bacterium]|nr:GNAT family N-acetyltransferase [Anaerolineales bacterium]
MLMIRLATPADFPALATFIETHNQNPSTHCIQSSTGEGAENLREEIEKLHSAGEMMYVLAEEADQLLGVLGCECAVSERRGWVRGPLIAPSAEPGPEAFPALAGRLFDAMSHALPAEIVFLDTFLNVENHRGQTFYTSLGFWVRSHHHVYVAPRPEQPKTPRLVCAPMPPAQLPVVQALHNTVFPGIRTGEDVLQGLDEDHRVWVYAPEGDVMGYVFAVIESWAEGGYVEFLGVREDARGKGVGAALLATALHWCFAERGVPEVGLTVEDGNVNARSMYERAGFRLKYSGINQRLERGL